VKGLRLNIAKLRKVLEEGLCCWLDDKDVEELLEKGELILYDEERDVNKFYCIPRIKKYWIRVVPPLVYVHLLLRHGPVKIEVPIECINLKELEE